MSGEKIELLQGPDPNAMRSLLRGPQSWEAYREERTETGPIRLCQADLCGFDLAAFNLENCDLRGADLAAAKLMGTNLTGADLTRSCLNRANLAGATLHGADVTGAEVTDAVLDHEFYRHTVGKPLSTSSKLTESRPEYWRQLADLVVARLTQLSVRWVSAVGLILAVLVANAI